MKKIITLLFFVCLYHVGFSQWVSLNSLPVGRSGGTSFAIGSKGYTVAGGGSCGCYRNDLWVYDSGADSWTQLLNYPSGQDNSPVAFAIGDTGYVGTGAAGNYSYSSSFYKYDPNSNTWTTIASIPTPNITYTTDNGRCAGVSFVINNKGYVGGGLNSLSPSRGNNNPNNDFYVYDPSTGQWDSIARCPARGVGVNAVAFAINGKGYVGTGGQFPSGSQTWTPQNDFWRYDPSTNTWDSIAPYPGGGRMTAFGYATCNKGYVGAGLSDAAQSQFQSDFYEYDPTVGSLGAWTKLADYAGTGLNKPSSFVIGADGYVNCGNNSTGTSVGDLFKYISSSGGATLDIEPKSFSVCQGQLVALTVTGGSGQGSNLVWSPSTGLNQPIGDTVLATINADVVYTVTSSGNCSSSGTDTITVKTSNPLTFTPANPTACPGVDIAIVVSGGTSFTWNPSTGVVPSGDSLIASLSASVDSVVYTVIGLNQQGCPDTSSVILRSGGNVIAGTITATRDTICLNTPGNLTITNSLGNSLQWQYSTDDINFTSAQHDTLTSYRTPPLQQTTWYRVLEGSGNCSAISDTFPLIVPPALTAYFNLKQGTNNQLKFSADSSVGQIKNYHWDFGDGNISDGSNDSTPSHTFAKDTIYYVCLTLYDGSNCSYTFCRYSQVISGVPTVSAAGSWIIYPNPFSEQLTVSSKQGNSRLQSIEMYDVLGQLVINKNVGNSTNTSLQLDVSSLANGMYYVMIKTADADYVQKVVKQ